VIRLAENRYGKSSVRLVKVNRDRPLHDVKEWKVEVLLTGRFESCFLEGDNSNILATDTMKNTVYSLARDSAAECIEDFAKELIEFLLERNPQVEKAEIAIASTPWEHAVLGGEPYSSAFVRGGGELQTTAVTASQMGAVSVISGLDNLVLLKTANSGFEGFLRDSLTTLPETADRLFGTALRAQWSYKSSSLSFTSLRTKLRDTLIRIFAEHNSKSVQHTLYAMGKAALESHPEIEDVEIVMPNKHCLLVDLSRFGQTNPNEIFVPTEEPYGYIEARMRREA
jgi:urate oxidase